MSGESVLRVALITAGSFVLALALMAGLWTIGLRLLRRLGRRRGAFEVVVALGQLRGRKSGYLKFMTLVVLLAFTMAGWTLPTVLSVMGGFGDDLKQKIRASTADVIVDAARPELAPPDAPQLDYGRYIAQQLRPLPEVKLRLTARSETAARRFAVELEKRGVAPERIELRIGREVTKGVRVTAVDGDPRVADYRGLARKIAAVDGVAGVMPYIDADVMLASRSNITTAVLKGIDTERMDDVIALRRSLEHDRAAGSAACLDHPERIAPEAEDDLPGAIVGVELARTLAAGLGEEINVVSPLGELGPTGPIPRVRVHRLGGIFYSGLYVDDARNAYVRLAVAQAFLGMGRDEVTGLRVRVADIDEADVVATRLRAALGPRFRVRSWREINVSLFSALALERVGMYVLYSVFFVICAFLIASTMAMMVLEKRQSIAVLKTLGASNGALGRVFLLQGLVTGLVGTVSGQAAAVAQCLALRAWVEIDSGVWYVDRLPIALNPADFLIVGAIALFTAGAATALPLLATVMLRPVDGLRM